MTSAEQIDRIMEVMAGAFDPQWGESWTRRQIADSLAFPHTDAILIDENGCMDDTASARVQTGQSVGFLLSRRIPGEEELLLVAVLPQFRGRGLGSKLLEQFTYSARERGTEGVFLEMRRNNPAISLYRKAGFEPIGTRANYYTCKDGSKLDAITFRLALQGKF